MQTTASGVLVTGATGFIGRHIVRTLLAGGHQVTALIRPGKLSDPRLPSNCIQIPASITDIDQLKKVVPACEAVVYCAGSVRGGRLEDFQVANIDGLKAVLTALDQTGTRLPLLLMSSLAASRPALSDYSFSKFTGEQALMEQSDLAWTIIRPPAVYGPGDKEMLPLLKLAAKGWVLNAGPRDQRVSLLHVEDLAQALLAWLNQPGTCLHQTFSIDDGTARGYDWPAIAEAAGASGFRRVGVPDGLLKTVAKLNLGCAKLFRYAPMLTPGKVRELTQQEWLSHDNDRFEAATGWRPMLDLKAGLQALLASKGDWKTSDALQFGHHRQASTMELQLNDSIRVVAEKLAAILSGYLKDNPGNTAKSNHVISPDTNMVTDLQLDSFQVMEFMLEVEDHYDVAIDLVSLSNIHTITDLASVVIAAQQD